jgi:hypothetical protein
LAFIFQEARTYKWTITWRFHKLIFADSKINIKHVDKFSIYKEAYITKSLFNYMLLARKVITCPWSNLGKGFI